MAEGKGGGQNFVLSEDRQNCKIWGYKKPHCGAKLKLWAHIYYLLRPKSAVVCQNSVRNLNCLLKNCSLLPHLFFNP